MENDMVVMQDVTSSENSLYGNLATDHCITDTKLCRVLDNYVDIATILP